MPKIRRKRYFQRSLKRNLPVLRTAGYVLIVVVLLGTPLFAIFKTDLFKISKVNVVGAGSFVSAVDVQSLVESSALGKNIFFLDRKDMHETLLKNFRGAREIIVKVKLPNKLVLEVSERDPLALITNDQVEDHFVIDSEGLVLGVVDETKTNLPKIKYEGEINVGEFISSSLVPVYLDLMRGLDENEVQASSVSFYPRYVRLYIQDGIEVLIGNDKDKVETLRIVKELVRQERMEKKSLSKIDMRYDKVSVQ
jgi:cell division septal protein FtsQ